MALASLGCAAAPPTAPSAAGGSGNAREDYAPEAPFAYDGRYLDCSFEENQGHGWDTCFTHTPERLDVQQTGAADGMWFLTFASGTDGGVWDTTYPSASLFYCFLASSPGSAKMGLYFDVKILHGDGDGTAVSPTGALTFYGTNLRCEQETALAAIDLAELHLSSAWTTRCVDVTDVGSHEAVGVSVTGGAHLIGLDAIRLGPRCHGQN